MFNQGISLNDWNGLSGVANPPLLRLSQVRAERGTRVNVPVILDARGGEAGLSFSVYFQVLGLANPEVTAGPDGAGWSLTINPNNVGSGRIGVLMDRDPQDPLTPGSKHIVTLSFDVLSTALEANGIEFVRSPIPLSTADYMANNVVTVYQNGDVLIGNAAAPTRPVLPIGYEGSYAGGDPVYTPPPNNTDPLYVEPPITQPAPGGTINTGSGTLTPGGGDNTIFGMSPLFLIAIAAGAFFLFGSDKK